MKKLSTLVMNRTSGEKKPLKPLKLGILGLLPALFLLAAVGVIWASTSGLSHQRGHFGVVSKVTSVSGASTITLDTSSGPVTVTARPETTNVGIPGQERAFPRDISVGDSVAVLASSGQAISILVKQERPVQTRHFIGVVTFVGEDSTVGITDDRGNQISAVGSGEVSDLRPGELVTAILSQDLRTGALVITGLERAIDNLARTQAALARAEQSGAAANLEVLKARLASNSTRHLTVLQEVAQRAPPGVRPRVRAELQTAQESYAPVLSRFDAGSPSAEVSGIITFVGSLNQPVTIQPPGLDQVDVSITTDTSIRFQGQEIGFNLLQLGNRVIAQYDLATQTSSRILVLPGERLDQGVAEGLLRTVGSGEATGVIIDVDPDLVPPRVTIDLTEPLGAEPLTLSLSAASVIRADGDQVQLDAILGNLVSVGFVLETLEVIEIDTLTITPGQESVSGVVHSFIPKTKEDLSEPLPYNFSILTPDGEVRNLNHTKDTIIRRDGRQLDITRVRVGDLVRPNTRFVTASNDLILLSLRSPQAAQVRGTIRSITISPEGQDQVTISGDGLEVLTVFVTPATDLDQLGQAIQFGDLAVGQRVLNGTHDPLSWEAIRLELGPPRSAQVRGQITAIDLSDLAITITTPQGEEVTLFVFKAKRTRINLRGNPTPLFSDLQVGDEVRVGFYDPNTKEALNLVIT